MQFEGISIRPTSILRTLDGCLAIIIFHNFFEFVDFKILSFQVGLQNSVAKKDSKFFNFFRLSKFIEAKKVISH